MPDAITCTWFDKIYIHKTGKGESDRQETDDFGQ